MPQGSEGSQPKPRRTASRGGQARRRNGRWLRQVDEFSAGGLVVDLDGDVPRAALIARTDRRGRLLWSLPKGHIEAGETAEQAAVREVEEETGISGVILAELGTIDFWFVADGRRIHKTVQHYLMRATGGELSDADIEVTEVAWVPLSDIRAQLAYPDERGLVDAADRLLAESGMRPLLAAVVAAAAVVLAAPTAMAQATPRLLAAPAALTAGSVTVAVVDVAPNTPIPTPTPTPLTISLELTNTTDRTLAGVTVTADRGDPISSQKALDGAISDPKPPSPDLVSPVHTDPVSVDLPPGATVPVDYVTSTSSNSTVGAGICLCNDAATPLFIYPLVFTATYKAGDTSTAVGTAQMLLPSFQSRTVDNPLQVSWIWPLLDRPHRLRDVRLFLDDDLSGEVADGGRLDRALRVVEDVSPRVPMTLVVDPELLDELEVMASGDYRVSDPSAPTRPVAGTGATVARAWLNRFRTLVDAHPDVEVELTPFGDPDVESLHSAGTRLAWSQSLSDPGSAARLADALGTRAAQSTVTWPVGGTLGQSTLAELVQRGTRTVVVTDRTLRGGRDDTDLNALARVNTAAGEASAVVTSSTLQDVVDSVLKPAGAGLGALPELVSRLAIRVAASPGVAHYVALTAPRQLDVDPITADRAILATAGRFWSTPMTVDSARASVSPSNRGVLRVDPDVPGIPADTLQAIGNVRSTLPGLTGADGLFDNDTQNATPGTPAVSSTVTTVGKLPAALQRTTSCELIDDPKASISQSGVLSRYVDRVRRAVHLVQPAGNASYTLTANDAPLPVTVTNPLDVDVTVRISVLAEGNLPGFKPRSMVDTIAANSTKQERIPTSIDITGRINVLVTLSTKGQMAIGTGSLHLSVRSTALGTVGVAITTIAAIVLALALLVRLYRAIRWRRRRSPGRTRPVTDPLAP